MPCKSVFDLGNKEVSNGTSKKESEIQEQAETPQQEA
jgi:hypothetical protein